MKFVLGIAAGIMLAVSVKATHLENEPVSQSQDLVPRAHDNDRGTWNFRCAGAESACNNACFSIYCRKDGSEKMYYDPGDNNDRHRFQSGCRASSGSRTVCNTLPFSQSLNDPQDLKSPTCDEWPMAEVLQDDFNDRPDNSNRPNSLRCMERGENGSGGSQLADFLDLGKNPNGRKGTDPFQKGDYWMVKFDLDSKNPKGEPANLDKLQYCKKDPDCTNDGYQFILTKLSGTNGNLKEKYDYDNNNHYRIYGSDKDIAQCSVHLRREQETVGAGRASISRVVYKATVSQQGQQQGAEQTGRPSDSSPLVVKGLAEDLKIFPNTKSIADFKSDARFEIGGFKVFGWQSTTAGKQKNPYSDTDPGRIQDPDEKKYCNVGKANNVKGTQDMDCWFPCPYKA